MGLLRRLIGARPGPSNGGSTDEAVALVQDLAERITSPDDAPLILGRVATFEKARPNERRAMLPSIYLLLEQYLSEVDRGDYAPMGLRQYVKSHYPGLLVESRFQIIFERAQRQEVLLCRAFLQVVLTRARGVLGGAGDNLLGRTFAWLAAVPGPSAGSPPLPPGAKIPNTDQGWTDLLIAVSKALHAHIAGMLGDQPAGRIYEDAYRNLAADLVGLETFPVIVGAMPGDLISEEKVQLLSKSQIQRVLVEKVRSLELVNELLYSKNEELIEAQRELVVARHEAESANEAKSAFLSRMSHELRTPLNSVIGFANQVLKNREENLTEKDLMYLGRVRTNGLHLLELINNLLDLAKVESGRLEVNVDAVDVSELVDEVLDSLEGKLVGTTLTLTKDVPRTVGPLETDRMKLKRVLINLVGNAIKFTEDGGVTVRVRTDPADGRPTAIDVSDTGIGIRAEDIGSVFEVFHQVEDGQARRFAGSGLGLAISRSLCDVMGYSLTVESTFGDGTCFTIGLVSADKVLERASVDSSGASDRANVR